MALLLERSVMHSYVDLCSKFTLQQELMVVFRHLMSTNHRRVLFDHLDKLFDERVLLGTGIASKEMLR